MPFQRIVRVARLSKQRSLDGQLGFLRQFAEMAYLRVFHSIGPNYYHTARLWRRDLSWSFKKGHLGSSQYSRRLQQINPLAYRKISQNKLSEKGMLALFNIPSTVYLGYFCDSLGESRDGDPLTTISELENWLEKQAPVKICFKPTEGWAGSGFSAVEVLHRDGALEVIDLSCDRTMPLAEFVASSIPLSQGSGWIIEEYFQQHALLKEWNSSSLNTLRVWVTREAYGPGRVIGAFLRLGRAGAIVDNQEGSRIVARVELDTGRLSAATNGEPELHCYKNHPDSNVQIEGQPVPHWEEAKALSCRALEIFPELHFAGLDIAIGPHHPAVVELNVEPDKMGAAFMDISPAQYLTMDLR